MVKSVVLARPHPFLVSDMRPWLERGGFEVLTPKGASDLPDKVKRCSRAVVSLALSSPIELSAEEVMHVLRAQAPNTRILFAALLPFEKARPGLERLADQLNVNAVLTDLGALRDVNHSALGRSTTFAYLSKDDLSDETRRARISEMLITHFA